MGKTENTSDIPFVARVFRNVFTSVPKVNFPGSQLSISFSLVSMVFFLTIRTINTKFLRTVIGWPDENIDDAAACMTSIVHSTVLCPCLLAAFWTHKYAPSEPMSKAPQWWQELVDGLLQFCTGYMIYDFVFILGNRILESPTGIPQFTDDDILFLGHHFMTSTYMSQARLYGAGHMSAMMCMLLGELSNPMMNGWFITHKAITYDCCNGEVMQLVHKVVEINFCIQYLILRVVVGPIACTHMSYSLTFSEDAKKYLPGLVRFFWNLMIWAVILGSYSWIVYSFELFNNHFGGTGQEL